MFDYYVLQRSKYVPTYQEGKAAHALELRRALSTFLRYVRTRICSVVFSPLGSSFSRTEQHSKLFQIWGQLSINHFYHAYYILLVHTYTVQAKKLYIIENMPISLHSPCKHDDKQEKNLRIAVSFFWEKCNKSVKSNNTL